MEFQTEKLHFWQNNVTFLLLFLLLPIIIIIIIVIIVIIELLHLLFLLLDLLLYPFARLLSHHPGNHRTLIFKKKQKQKKLIIYSEALPLGVRRAHAEESESLRVTQLQVLWSYRQCHATVCVCL